MNVQERRQLDSLVNTYRPKLDIITTNLKAGSTGGLTAPGSESQDDTDNQSKSGMHELQMMLWHSLKPICKQLDEYLCRTFLEKI